MARRLLVTSVMLLALARCGPPERPPPPYFVIPPGEPAAATTPKSEQTAPAPMLRSQLPVQLFLPPAPESEFMRGPQPVPEPGPQATPFFTPSYNGPITGYGPGGMALPPGAPPNPPYPRGGLTGPR